MHLIFKNKELFPTNDPENFPLFLIGQNCIAHLSFNSKGGGIIMMNLD